MKKRLKKLINLIPIALILVGLSGVLSLFTIVAIDMSTKLVIDHSGRQISEAQVQRIYDNLGKYTGLRPGMLPPLVILDSDDVNAQTDGSTVVIFTGMIKFAKSESEIAGVLAHELGHVLLNHNALDGVDPQELLEGNADKWGTYLVLRAGYDVCQMRDLWYRLREEGGDYELNSDHPNYSYRAWQLEFPQCEVYHG